MEKIIITTDSGIDPICEENMIPGQIIENGEKSYRDKIDINQKEILNKIKEGSVFKTASPLIGDYEDKFVSILERKKDVIHLSMSSGISEGSVNSANLIANILNEEYENKVYVIDTLNGATGGTLIDILANNLVKQGLTTKEITEKLNSLKKYVQTSFFVPNPEGFIKSGRNKSELCLKDKAKLIGTKAASMAGIKYRVDFNDEGNLYVKSTMKCKTKLGMLKLIKSILNEQTIENYKDNYVVIGNVLEKDVEMNQVKEYIEQLEYFKNIVVQDINGVVAAYGSEDLCGISLIKK